MKERINFNGKTYPCICIDMPFGEAYISVEKLNEQLMNEDGSYVSDEAQYLDESIFYFVDEKDVQLSEDKLVEKILGEI